MVINNYRKAKPSERMGRKATGLKGPIGVRKWLFPKLASVLAGSFLASLHEEHRDQDAEIRFLNNALGHFKDSDWINIMQKRMEDLKAAEGNI
jgi:hypothetical protein